MFDRFVRFAPGGERLPGTGLGLAICRSIVALHAGAIRAVPGEAGRGLAVEIRLPVVGAG
jgi:two-component system heavy metal sensor histidine kinase CusS